MGSVRVLAVTGGIGAGKSYVSARFSEKGVPVYDSDGRTKDLYDTDSSLLDDIAGIVGPDVVRADGKLDRRLMAERIFSDRDMLAAVEAVVFPRVIEDFQRWKSGFDSGFVIMESAIFLMKPILYPVADKVLYVDAPENLRIERVMRRDKASRDAVLARMANQTDCRSMADWVVDTSIGDEYLEGQILSVISKMLYLCDSDMVVR